MLAVIALLAWLYLLVLHGRFWTYGPALKPRTPRETPPVAIIVPARDEAEVIARSIGSLLAQTYAGPFKVILVDDRSTDGTAAIASALDRAHFNTGRLSILAGADRPEGWAGKLWAVHQGVMQTTEPLILLTDADIEHDPSHLATLVAQAETSGADLVSEMVRLHCQTPPERALIPAFVYFFAMLYPFNRVNQRHSSTSAAAGGTMLIKRTALDRIGGIKAIRGALIDDVSLATAVKRGGSIWLGHSELARSIRPYLTSAEIWRMIARSAYVQLRYSPLLLLGSIAGLTLVFLAPPVTALSGSWIGLVAWTLMAVSFLPTLKRFGRSVLWAPLLPLITLFYMAATIGAAVDYHRGRGIVWKGQIYRDRA
jgi:hopene-associated glycosyltransferase HpnB